MATSKPEHQISIYDFAETCEALFDQLLTVLSTAGEDHYQIALQLHSSFERWAGFLGVFAAQHVSLDRRLESSPQIRDRFIRLLKVIERNAKHALGFESARRQILQRENASPPSKSEAGRKLDAISLPISPGTKAALQGIQEALEGLHRIGVAVRRTSKSSLTFRVKKFTQKAKNEFDFYERMDLLIVKGLYPSISSSLAKQLAETVSFRRARLQFQRSRQTTLETRRVRLTEHTMETPQSVEPTEQIKDVTGTAPTQHLKDKAQHSGTRSTTSTTHGASTATDLTPVDDQLFLQDLATEETPGTATGSSGPLTVSGIGHSNPYPQLPNDAQCNWCFRDHKISRNDDGWKQAWKNHFKRDLEPYVCISDECSSNLQYFASLRDWQHHMKKQHTLDWIEKIHQPATWFCETGDHDYQDFVTEAELRNHLQAAHSDRFNSEQQDTVVKRNVVYISRGHDTCPLCGTDVASLLQNDPQQDPSLPPTKPQPLAKPSSSSKKPAKQLRFETPADPVNSDEEDCHEDSDSRIDAYYADEPTAEDVLWRTNQIRLSTHVAGHLKSLAFTSLRYFDDGNDGSASQGSKRAASGDAGEKLSSEAGHGDHYFELEELDETSFQDIPRDQRNDEKEAQDQESTSRVLQPEEKEACLRSLSFPSISLRQENIPSAHRGTCNWLFETSTFQQWRNRSDLSSHNGVLWIKGKPGTGKSTLMKHILSHCEEIFEGHVIAAYFFWAAGTSLERTSLGMLRSLLYQLLDQDPVLYERFIPIFREKTKIGNTWEWREEELKEFLLSAIKGCQSKPLVLLIDALDECNEAKQQNVVAFIESLSISAKWSNVVLNICLSSRHYPLMDMRRSLELVVDERNQADIAVYTRDKLRKRDDEIEKRILEKACGVFLWVHHAVQMLNKAYLDGDSVKDMHMRLEALPRDLEYLFQALLDRRAFNKTETILMLQWVSFARRPLKPEELYLAATGGIASRSLRAWNSSEITGDDIQRRITSSSKGLIEVCKGQQDTVQFIHESVYDFLLHQGFQTLDSKLGSNPIGRSHDCLRLCCVTYLTMEERPLPKDESERQVFTSSYPFLQYASTYVFEHAEEAQARGVEQNDFLQLLQDQDGLFERIRLFHNYFEQDEGLRWDPGASLADFLSAHDYERLVHSLLNEGADIDA